jgi:hypothetical protein
MTKQTKGWECINIFQNLAYRFKPARFTELPILSNETILTKYYIKCSYKNLKENCR